MTVTPLPAPKAETAIQAVQRLERQAAESARRTSDDLNRDLADAAADALAASALRTLPHGVRDLYRRLAERIAADLQNIHSITGRA